MSLFFLHRCRAISVCVFMLIAFSSFAHEIIFCGEHIPVENDFVAQKLMNVIRRQVPNVNFPELRRRVKENFPIVEYYLRETGLPEDLKYIAVVESGFTNITSSAGAQGFWQLMPSTAEDWGLSLSPVDERNNIYKSTYAACKHLASNYLQIKKKYGISSWILTAAAYNYGISNMFKFINNQGKDYFSMSLNAETAAYVYKIIAVKELFEYPELYMRDFGYNLFSNIQRENIQVNPDKVDTGRFSSMEVAVKTAEVNYPDAVNIKEPARPGQEIFTEKPQVDRENKRYSYLLASIKGKYKNFEDGQLITIELLENLEVRGSFNRKGNLLLGNGWVIDNRVYINLGFDEHDVTLLDMNGVKGIELSSLKNKETVLLKVQQAND